MAAFVSIDAFVSINGVDLSAAVKSVAVSYSAEPQDSTSMGDNTRERLGGLKDWSVEVEFNQDFAAANVDATLFPLVGAASTVIVRPVKATAVGATNPNYSGSALLESYSPIGASVGDLAPATASFIAAGALSRLTA